MVRPPHSLVLSTIAAIAAGGVLMASSTSVQACPLGVGKPDSAETVRRSDSPDSSSASPDRFQPFARADLASGHWGIWGTGVVAALLAVGIVSRVRRSHQAAIADEVLFESPELEHPELLLTPLPKEALACSLVEREVILTR